MYVGGGGSKRVGPVYAIHLMQKRGHARNCQNIQPDYVDEVAYFVCFLNLPVAVSETSEM